MKTISRKLFSSEEASTVGLKKACTPINCSWHWVDSQTRTQNGSLSFLTSFHRWGSPRSWLTRGDVDPGGLLAVLLEGEGKKENWGQRGQAAIESQRRTRQTLQGVPQTGRHLTAGQCWRREAGRLGSRFEQSWDAVRLREGVTLGKQLPSDDTLPREGWQLRVVCCKFPPAAG